MSVLIRFCLIESFNIKVGKGNVLMRNLKVFYNEYFMRIIQKENKSAYLHLEINVP
jgi:hypothetical protein